MPPSPATVSVTTAHQSITYTTEADLIGLVKDKRDSDATAALITANTGIYLTIVDRYATAYPNTIRRNDLADDKLFNIYRFILDYDPTRGTKLSTYIGDRTSWMCKTLLKQDVRNPVRAGTYGPSGAMMLADDTYTTEGGQSHTLVDESAEADVAAVVDKDMRIEDIMAAAWGVCEDKRFAEILGYRHFNHPGPTSLSWRQIGEKMSISHERARTLYHEGMALVKQHLKDRVA